MSIKRPASSILFSAQWWDPMFSEIWSHFQVKASSLSAVASDPTVIPGWLGAWLLQEVTHPAGWQDEKSPQSNTISHTAWTAPTPSHPQPQAPPPFHTERGFIHDQMYPYTLSTFLKEKPWGIRAGLCNRRYGSGHSMMESIQRTNYYPISPVQLPHT